MNPIRSFIRNLLPALMIALLLAAASLAQVAGKLDGTVIDPQGAVVPNAKITAKNNQTQTQLTATTGKEGNFTLPSVSAGSYSLTIAAPGFKSVVFRT
ncbi:MAG: carboxypeptidase-like regulatory domain-containing protein [Acidobacteriota bacterium]